MRNVAEGLERYSDRRAAQLIGWSRTQLWRARMMANIPDDLFELLLSEARTLAKLTSKFTSTKELAAIGHALHRGHVDQHHERCWHCGATLRVRASVRPEMLEVVNDWLRRRAA
jgi:hypothetical protein